MLLVWSNSFSVGSSKMDLQHRHIIDLMNELGEVLAGGENDLEKVDSILQSLINHACDHFKDEEDLMRKCGFPDLDKHILTHKKIVRKILDMQTQFESGVHVGGKLMNFLSDWLLTHIMEEDMAYKPFLTNLE